jgi:starch synthase
VRVAIVASEVTPFAKTGGLGDVTAALAKHLHRRGCEVRLFLPLYGNLRPSGQTFHEVAFARDMRVPLGPRVFGCSLVSARLPGTDLPVHFVRNPTLFGRESIYSGEGDEHLRFALLSKAAIEGCQRMGFAPQVFHCHDWHTALVPLLLRTEYAWDRLFHATRTLLTIHNLAYQGSCGPSAVADLGLSPWAGWLHQEHLARGRFSFLETGILHAHALSTVSVTHAAEMTTPEHGMGLDAMLRARRATFTGIVNGIDAEVWDPATDRHLAARYSRDDLSGKARCKQALLEEVGLRHHPRVPVIGVVSRFTAQKGFDLAFEALPPLLRHREVRLVALGGGERRYERFFAGLEREFPDRVRWRTGQDEGLAHRIEAGADLFLMPSLFEPCGLNQMYSQRYGTLPVVRRTGGLADTVTPYDPARRRGTGFVFDHFTADGLAWALRLALDTWEDRDAWLRLQQEAMAQDFSWDRRIDEYLALYAQIQRGR